MKPRQCAKKNIYVIGGEGLFICILTYSCTGIEFRKYVRRVKGSSFLKSYLRYVFVLIRDALDIQLPKFKKNSIEIV